MRFIISTLCSHCHNVISPSIYDKVGVYRCWHCQIWLREEDVIQGNTVNEPVTAHQNGSIEDETRVKRTHETSQDLKDNHEADKPVINQAKMESQLSKDMAPRASKSIAGVKEGNNGIIEQINPSSRLFLPHFL